MSKKNQEAEAEAEVVEGAEAAVETPKAPDRRLKQIITPAGESINRTNYIRDLWAAGNMTRAQIRDHLANECTSENGENNIAYQIVFSGTNGLPGGPSEEVLAAVKAEKEAAKVAKAAEKAAEKAAAKAAKASATPATDGEAPAEEPTDF